LVEDAHAEARKRLAPLSNPVSSIILKLSLPQPVSPMGNRRPRKSCYDVRVAPLTVSRRMRSNT
jgi:hypothetical protein